MQFNTVEEFKQFKYEDLEAMNKEDLINTLNHLLAVGGLSEGETYFEGVSKDMFGQSSKIGKLLSDRGIGKKRNGNFYEKEETSLEAKVPNVSFVDLEIMIRSQIEQKIEEELPKAVSKALEMQKKNYIFIDNDLYDCESKKTTIQLSTELHNVIMLIQKDFKHTNMNLLINQAVKEFAINHNYLIEEVKADPEQEQ